MEFFDKFVFFAGLILVLSVVAGAWSNRGSVPTLLIFLGIGMLFGEDGPGNISFDNFGLSYLTCTIALAIILFDGGFNTSSRQFKIGIRPALGLATIGVFITAIILAVFLALLTGIGFLEALLLGTSVASTDAAAVFMLLAQQKIKLRQRIVSLLETESGMNDPMAIFLTIGIVEALSHQAGLDVMHLIPFFFQQMILGVLVGVAGGYALVKVVERVPIPHGMESVLGIAGALTIFGGAAVLHGSGFMAVYIAGLIFGNGLKEKRTNFCGFLDSMAWLSQIVMLLLLGLLVTPSEMLEDLPVALVAVIALIFIARPAAVFASLHFTRFKKEEKIFISWVGLRGAVPIYLAMIPALKGIENSDTYFNVAFAVVLISLLIQGWTIRPLARYLKLDRSVV